MKKRKEPQGIDSISQSQLIQAAQQAVRRSDNGQLRSAETLQRITRNAKHERDLVDFQMYRLIHSSSAASL
jgi:hypothetical protein